MNWYVFTEHSVQRMNPSRPAAVQCLLENEPHNDACKARPRRRRLGCSYKEILNMIGRFLIQKAEARCYAAARLRSPILSSRRSRHGASRKWFPRRWASEVERWLL